MIDTHTNKARQPGTNLSLKNILGSLNADIGCTWHCSGNDAFGMLLALQLLLQPENTQIPVVKPIKRSPTQNPLQGLTVNTTLGSGYITPTSRSPIGAVPTLPRPITAYFEYPEAPSRGYGQQGSGQRRSPGRGTPQPQQPEARSPFLRGGALSIPVNDATQAGAQDSFRTGVRTSNRSPIEVLRLGGSRIIQG